MNEQIQYNLRQLRRALENKVPFRTAYYIVFSDYPSLQSLSVLRDEASGKLRDTIVKQMTKLLKNS